MLWIMAMGPQPLTVRRRLLRLGWIMLATVILTFLAVLIGVYFLQARLIFFPSREYTGTPRDEGLAYEEIALKAPDGRTVAAWYVPRDGAAGTVLFCHGNAGNISDRLGGIRWLHDLGYSVLIFDYRGYGKSGGSPSERGMYEDADAAWRWLTESRGETPERVILFGESIGSAVAVELASRYAPSAVVLEGAFTSLIDVGCHHYPWLPVRWFSRYRYDSLSRIGRVRSPLLFIHANGDEIVPFEHGQRLFEAAPAPKQFLETPGGHNTGGFRYTWDYAQKMRDLLESLRTAGTRSP